MPRQTTKYSVKDSKNSHDVAKQHYDLERMKTRGMREGLSDSQPCELTPPDIHKAELADAWREGYREAWKSKGAKS